MKSILIITSFLPYPIHSGGEQAQYNMIEALRKTYSIGIIFPMNRDNRAEDVEALSSLWPEVRLFPFPLISQYTHLPFLVQKAKRFLYKKSSRFHQVSLAKDVLDQTDFLTSKAYLNLINHAIAETKPDMIQVEFIQNLNIGGLLPHDIKKVFVHHEIGFVMADRMLKNVSLTHKQQHKKEQKKRQEIARLNQYDGVLTLTETDKDVLAKSGVKPPIYVSPAAVNTREKEYDGWNGQIVFIGGYHHRPNQEGMDWFLREVTPCVDWSKYPQTQLKIVGLGWPTSYEGNFNGLNVHLAGYVDDLSEHVSRTLMIVPLLTGSGMRMKILDASALSVPFVSTSVGAEGLNFSDGDTCMIADSAIEFAQALVKLMEDHPLQEAMARKAHHLFKENYSLESLVERRKEIYKIV
jgi:glycosyltransferase involved in cell wall biosynthesis